MKRQQNVAMNMKFPLGGNCLLENWLNFGNGGQTLTLTTMWFLNQRLDGNEPPL